MVFSPSGSIRMHPAPAPLLDFDPSKYNYQNKVLSIGLSTNESEILTILEESDCEIFLIWETKVFTEKGDCGVVKFPRNDSTK